MPLRIVTAALILAISTFPVLAAKPGLLLRAQELQVAQHYARAVKIYTQILNRQPELAAAWAGRGQSRLASGHSRGAAADFAHWRQLDSRDPYRTIWLYLASERSGGDKVRIASLLSDKIQRWPQPVIRYLAGQIDWETMFDHAESAAGATRDRELCEAALFYAENMVALGKMKSAMGGFNLARLPRCKSQIALQTLASSEYKKLYRAGFRPRPSE